MNCPEALQTATANRILPKQQSINSRKIPPRPKDIEPYFVYEDLVPPETVGIFMYPVSVDISLSKPAL